MTGASGFIGRPLLEELTRHSGSPVRCLVRTRPLSPLPAGVETVAGDLREPSTYRHYIRAGDAVIHLGGLTGKASPSDYFSVNVDGTKALLAEAVRAGVRRFVFVSSIAATYSDARVYHYAASKALAEQAVRESSLEYVIVRPTLVLGPGSPILEKLVLLASLPILPVIGNGLARVQPVHVNDVAVFLSAVISSSEAINRTIELGGPEVVTFENLLKRLRRMRTGRTGPVVHLPAGAIIRLLAAAGRPLASWLPFNAGQFSAFVNDSVAQSDPMVSAMLPRMTGLDQMLRG